MNRHCFQSAEPLPPLEPLGCFHDNLYSRALPDLYTSVRGQINWFKMELVVRMCARVALDKGYSYFGIQFYGECYSGDKAAADYAKHGKADQDYCVEFDKNLGFGVGKDLANFVYRFKQVGGGIA